MPSLINRFYRKSGAEQIQFFVAYFITLFFSLVVALFPKRIILKRIGTVGVESSLDVPDNKKKIAELITKSIRRAVRFTPFKITCFAKAISGKYQLRRQGIKSTLYLGVAKEGTSKITAHAWLRCGNIIVTGKEEMGRFTTVIFFT